MNVVVTGASAGIGRAFALQYARAGAEVALVARGRDRLEVVAAEVEAAGGRAHVFQADIGDRTEVEKAMSAALERMGSVDVLVNNAGMAGGGAVTDLDIDRIERVMTVNYLGAVCATKAILPGMLERGSGTIINVASVAGRVGLPEAAAYSASKFAMVGFFESLAAEVSRRGVRVVTVNPGPVRTATFPHAHLPGLLLARADSVVRIARRAAARGSWEVSAPRYMGVAAVGRATVPPLYRTVMRALARFGSKLIIM
ncbi:MAG: SDR family NAD(P)-dependent oxidoreductase [Actinomycetota bacterium]